MRHQRSFSRSRCGQTSYAIPSHAIASSVAVSPQRSSRVGYGLKGRVELGDECRHNSSEHGSREWIVRPGRCCVLLLAGQEPLVNATLAGTGRDDPGSRQVTMCRDRWTRIGAASGTATGRMTTQRQVGSSLTVIRSGSARGHPHCRTVSWKIRWDSPGNLGKVHPGPTAA